MHSTCIRVSNREPTSAVGLFCLHQEIWHWLSIASKPWEAFAYAVGTALLSLCTLAGLHSVWMCDNPTSYSLRWGVPYRRISQPPQKKNSNLLSSIIYLLVWFLLGGGSISICSFNQIKLLVGTSETYKFQQAKKE